MPHPPRFHDDDPLLTEVRDICLALPELADMPYRNTAPVRLIKQLDSGKR